VRTPAPAPVIDTTVKVPSIAGAPRKSILVGESFEFTPSASDPDGRPLQLAIANLPRWSQFDVATGRLSGTPSREDVGTYDNVRISVSNGQASAVLPDFSLQVADTQSGRVTVSWDPPTANIDGTAVTNLAGFRVYYGQSPDRLTSRLDVANPGVTAVVVEDLSPTTWYFAVAAYTRENVEGERSDVVSRSLM
jgi:hypothetical protein